MSNIAPICPDCGRELVFVAIADPRSRTLWSTWQCDCDYRDPELADLYPPNLVGDIVRSREWDDGSISYDLGKLREAQ